MARVASGDSLSSGGWHQLIGLWRQLERCAASVYPRCHRLPPAILAVAWEKKAHTQLDPTLSLTNNTKIDIIGQLRPITPQHLIEQQRTRRISSKKEKAEVTWCCCRTSMACCCLSPPLLLLPEHCPLFSERLQGAPDSSRRKPAVPAAGAWLA